MKSKKKLIKIPIDIEAFKANLKLHLDSGYIDNLTYIEDLAWVKELEKKNKKA